MMRLAGAIARKWLSPAVKVTKRLDRRRHVARGGTPAPEVSTIVIEAHAIHDAQPRGRDFVFVFK